METGQQSQLRAGLVTLSLLGWFRGWVVCSCSLQVSECLGKWTSLLTWGWAARIPWPVHLFSGMQSWIWPNTIAPWAVYAGDFWAAAWKSLFFFHDLWEQRGHLLDLLMCVTWIAQGLSPGSALQKTSVSKFLTPLTNTHTRSIQLWSFHLLSSFLTFQFPLCLLCAVSKDQLMFVSSLSVF